MNGVQTSQPPYLYAVPHLRVLDGRILRPLACHFLFGFIQLDAQRAVLFHLQDFALGPALFAVRYPDLGANGVHAGRVSRNCLLFGGRRALAAPTATASSEQSHDIIGRSYARDLATRVWRMDRLENAQRSGSVFVCIFTLYTSVRDPDLRAEQRGRPHLPIFALSGARPATYRCPSCRCRHVNSALKTFVAAQDLRCRSVFLAAAPECRNNCSVHREKRERNAPLTGFLQSKAKRLQRP